MDEITLFLQGCKKLLWIGPVNFSLSTPGVDRTNTLVKLLDKIQRDCEITVVGKMACKEVMGKSWALSVKPIEDASTVWEFLKQCKLPGLMALDRTGQ